MRFRPPITLVLATCLMAGCAGGARAVRPAPLSGARVTVVDRERLARGGTLAVIPFYAGENVASSDELDRAVMESLSEMIGTLKSRSCPVVPVGVWDRADLILKGHVTGFRIRRGWWHPGRSFFAVSGELELVSGDVGRVLLTFSDEVEAAGPHSDPGRLGRELGRELGQALAGAFGSCGRPSGGAL